MASLHTKLLRSELRAHVESWRSDVLQRSERYEVHTPYSRAHHDQTLDVSRTHKKHSQSVELRYTLASLLGMSVRMHERSLILSPSKAFLPGSFLCLEQVKGRGWQIHLPTCLSRVVEHLLNRTDNSAVQWTGTGQELNV